MSPNLASAGRGSAATAAARAFSRVDEYLEAWKPLTPWGKDEKEARRVRCEREPIEALLDLGEAWEAFAVRQRRAGREPGLDRLAWHLGRLPRLPEPLDRGEGSLDAVELFALRKFLSNYRTIFSLLDGEARAAFGFPPAPRAVEEVFAPLGEEGESFRFAEGCDPRLPPLRARLAEIEAALRAARGEMEARILAATGLDFSGKDFLVSELPLGASAWEELLEPEPWDGAAHLLRPRPSREELTLGDERARLLAEERGVEAEVARSMSRAIAGAAGELGACAAALGRLDGARSRSLLCAGPGFVRPSLAAAGELLEVGEGRLLPLVAECERAGLRYSPLSIAVAERAVLLFGSNMGGKTVVLETLLFLQILAQSGFRVPAARFAAPLFPFIHFIGEGSEVFEGGTRSAAGEARGSGEGAGGRAGRGGLSGFGREIAALARAREEAGEGGLLAFDEFARTTTSGEAEALLGALLEDFAPRAGVKALFATHFRGVEAVEGSRRLRMRGLDHGEARRLAPGPGRGAQLGAGPAPAEAVARLNSLMRYEVVEDRGDEGASDALAVAGLLGLEARIVQNAARRYERRLARGATAGPETGVGGERA